MYDFRICYWNPKNRKRPYYMTVKSTNIEGAKEEFKKKAKNSAGLIILGIKSVQ